MTDEQVHEATGELWRWRWWYFWEQVWREADFQQMDEQMRRLGVALIAAEADTKAREPRGHMPRSVQEKLRPTIEEWTDAIEHHEHHDWHHEHEELLEQRVASEYARGCAETLEACAAAFRQWMRSERPNASAIVREWESAAAAHRKEMKRLK